MWVLEVKQGINIAVRTATAMMWYVNITHVKLDSSTDVGRYLWKILVYNRAVGPG